MGNFAPIEVLSRIENFWRKDFPVAQAALQAKTDNGISVTLNEVTLEDGDWVEIDANGEVNKVGATSVHNSFMVFSGGSERTDNTATEAVTVLFADGYEAKSSKYDTGGSYAAGTELTAQNGQLEVAVSTDIVCAKAMSAPSSGTLHFHTIGVGYVKA